MEWRAVPVYSRTLNCHCHPSPVSVSWAAKLCEAGSNSLCLIAPWSTWPLHQSSVLTWFLHQCSEWKSKNSTRSCGPTRTINFPLRIGTKGEPAHTLLSFLGLQDGYLHLCVSWLSRFPHLASITRKAGLQPTSLMYAPLSHTCQMDLTLG